MCSYISFQSSRATFKQGSERRYKEIVDNITDFVNERVDIVIGGPPCQGFSSANQQRIIDDPRNELYKYYIEAIKRIAPKFVLMENVRGMLSVAGQVVDDYKAIKIEKRDKFTPMTYHIGS